MIPLTHQAPTQLGRGVTSVFSTMHLAVSGIASTALLIGTRQSYKSNLQQSSLQNGWTPLMQASQDGDVEMVKILANAEGVEINHKSKVRLVFFY